MGARTGRARLRAETRAGVSSRFVRAYRTDKMGNATAMTNNRASLLYEVLGSITQWAKWAEPNMSCQSVEREQNEMDLPAVEE